MARDYYESLHEAETRCVLCLLQLLLRAKPWFVLFLFFKQNKTEDCQELGLVCTKKDFSHVFLHCHYSCVAGLTAHIHQRCCSGRWPPARAQQLLEGGWKHGRTPYTIGWKWMGMLSHLNLAPRISLLSLGLYVIVSVGSSVLSPRTQSDCMVTIILCLYGKPFIRGSQSNLPARAGTTSHCACEISEGWNRLTA